MKLCYGNMQNQTNFTSRGDERGMPQIAKASKQKEATITLVYGTRGYCRQVPTWNYFAPLRTQMEIQGSKEDMHNDSINEQQQEPPSQAGRPPPIVLTTETNLIACGVGGQPPAQGLSRKREHFFNIDMLQLPTSRRRDSTSFQLSGM
jgi:hypothetical protein